MRKPLVCVLLVLLFTFSFLLTLSAQDFLEGRCIKVYDGDTILVQIQGVDEDGAPMYYNQKVRFLGVDTPESSYNSKVWRDAKKELGYPSRYVKLTFFQKKILKAKVKQIIQKGNEAKRFAKALVSGKNVILEVGSRPYDMYGRLLAYVYVTNVTSLPSSITKKQVVLDEKAEQLFLNASLIRAKHAKLLFYEDRTYEKYFSTLYKKAKKKKFVSWRIKGFVDFACMSTATQ